MGKRLRRDFSADVKLNETTLVVTTAGPVQVPVEVFVEGGGELPDGLAPGEEERLAKLGAFTPLPSYEERVRAQGAALAQAPAFQDDEAVGDEAEDLPAALSDVVDAIDAQDEPVRPEASTEEAKPTTARRAGKSAK